MQKNLNQLINKYKELPIMVKAALWYMVCNFFQKGITTLTTPIFTRLMTTEQYGQFTLFVSWQSILVVVVTLKLSGGVFQQGLEKFGDIKDRFTSALLGLATTLTGIYAILYFIERKPLNAFIGLNTKIMIAMFVSVIMTCAFEMWAYRQRMEYKYIPMVIVTLFVGFMKPLTGIISVLHTVNKGEARIISLVAVEAVVYIILYFSIFKKNKTFVDLPLWKYAFVFNLPLIPHFLSQSILIQSDRIMINSICGAGYVGIYGLAYSISMLMSLVNNAVKDTLNPWIFKSIHEKRYSELRTVCNNIVLIIALMDLFVIAMAPELIRIFAPSSYHGAVWVIPPVSMSIFFTFLYCFFADVEYFYEKTKFIMVSSLMSALLNIGLNYVFIRRYGYIAAGYTTLASYIIYAFLHYLCYKRITKTELDGASIYDGRRLLIISIIFILCSAVFTILYNYLPIRLVLIAGIAVLLFRNKDQFVQLIKIKKGK